jgi:hypothetical protein
MNTDKKNGAETLFYSTVPSPIGTLVVVVSNAGLRIIEFGDRPFPPPHIRGVEWVLSEEKTRPYVQQITEYFSGTRTGLTSRSTCAEPNFRRAVGRRYCRFRTAQPARI